MKKFLNAKKILSIALSFFVFILSGSTSPFASKDVIKGYWVWAGISPSALPADTVLYIYQGAFTREKNRSFFVRKGLYPHPLQTKSLYLTFRLQGDLPNPEKLAHFLAGSIHDWQRHNVTVTGIQLDFDSPTAKLLQYSDFLDSFRAALPARYFVSITGLGDWVLHGDPTALRRIADTTDEIIFQLYQGRAPLADIEKYPLLFGRIRHHFKVGLLAQYPSDKLIAELQENRYFSGIVLFVQR